MRYRRVFGANFLSGGLDAIKRRTVIDLQQWSYEEGIAECLLGCCSDGGANGESVIYIAPAWELCLDASFPLAARGGFEVACEISGGEIKAVGIYSRLGGRCSVKNSFGRSVTLTGKGTELVFGEGGYIRFDTEAGKSYLIK